MRITVNGATLDVDEGCTVQVLLNSLDLGGRRVAVELNEEIVPRSKHAETPLGDADRLEIVQAIGGG